MNALGAYKENAVTTQSPGRIVVMLYDGAVSYLKQAVQKQAAGDMAEKGRLLNRAAAIIEELNFSLNMEAGGEVAQNLRRLYLFMIRHLHEAHFQKDAAKIRDVIRMLEELNVAWQQITD